MRKPHTHENDHDCDAKSDSIPMCVCITVNFSETLFDEEVVEKYARELKQEIDEKIIPGFITRVIKEQNKRDVTR